MVEMSESSWQTRMPVSHLIQNRGGSNPSLTANLNQINKMRKNSDEYLQILTDLSKRLTDTLSVCKTEIKSEYEYKSSNWQLHLTTVDGKKFIIDETENLSYFVYSFQNSLLYTQANFESLVDNLTQTSKSKKLNQVDSFVPIFRELFDEIKHGDQEHQDWLENKMNQFLINLRNKI